MAAPAKNRRWMVLQEPKGAPVLGKDIVLQEEPVPRAREGTFVVRVTSMSLDPYIRGTMNRVSYGQEQKYPRVMTCGAVGQVVESLHPRYPVGTLVQGQFGWQDYCVSKGTDTRILPAKLPQGGKPSWYFGVLGMPGATAYLGLTEICDPQPGEVVLVSSCTGAVGSLVGQIAKLRGCSTIGLTSSGKVELAKEYGYDTVIDYSNKTARELTKELRTAAPKGINCYFDNAGGPCTEAALMCLARFARVSVCGQIAYYNLKDPRSAMAYPATMVALTTSSRIEGFIVTELPKKSPGNHTQAWRDLTSWLDQGAIKVSEDESQGLENAFDEFLTLFHGLSSRTNVGKKVVHVAPLPLAVVPPPPTSKL